MTLSPHTVTGDPEDPSVPDAGTAGTQSVPAPSARPSRDELLTTAEVAREYRFAVGTLRYWRHIGYGPASFARGRRIVYRRSDVDAWISEQERLTRRGGIAA